VDFNANAVAQADRFGRFVLDQGRQHWRLAQQAADVALDRARLGPILGEEHYGANFARSKIGLPVPEAGQERRDDGEHERFATAPADDEPGFV
jgi:hypothetical protein